MISKFTRAISVCRKGYRLKRSCREAAKSSAAAGQRLYRAPCQQKAVYELVAQDVDDGMNHGVSAVVAVFGVTFTLDDFSCISTLMRPFPLNSLPVVSRRHADFFVKNA